LNKIASRCSLCFDEQLVVTRLPPARGRRRQGRSISFLKKTKSFYLAGEASVLVAVNGRLKQRTKVFYFFISKKNAFLPGEPGVGEQLQQFYRCADAAYDDIAQRPK
jgi:hypothetical protein